mgnify:CR=1 FL=1
MTEAYVFDAIRTPRGKGKKDGSLHEVKPINLLTGVLTELQRRNGFDTARVDDVVMGVVSPVGEQGSVIAKVAALKAGWDWRCSGVQINRFCASGLEAVNMATAKVKSGEADFAVGGGVEAMSRVPMGSDGGAWPVDPTSAFPTYFVPQGVSADMIATKYGFSRDDVDAYSMESHKRAAAAWADGRFSKSVIPVKNQLGLVQLDRDETIRPNTDMQSLGGLNPSFAMMGEMAFDSVINQRYPEVERVNHVHTPGNSSGIVDGSAGVLIGSLEAGQALGLKPRAKIRSMAVAGCEAAIMGWGPVPATQKALKRAGLSIDDIQTVELNEAFAAQGLAVLRELGLADDDARVNPNGGAIALGHPLGCSGARITGTLLNVMEWKGGKAKDKPVAFVVVPIFGFANAGVSFAGVTPAVLVEPLTLGVAAGIALGAGDDREFGPAHHRAPRKRRVHMLAQKGGMVACRQIGDVRQQQCAGKIEAKFGDIGRCVNDEPEPVEADHNIARRFFQQTMQHMTFDVT